MNFASRRPKIWTISFCLLIFISLASTGIVDALQAALPIFVDNIGREATISGALVAVFSCAAVIPFLVSGALIDRFGCRKVLLSGGAVFLLGTIGPLFTLDLKPLFLFRILQGIGFAAVNVASATGATNILPRERLGEGVGYFGLGQSLAMAIGPGLGLWLVMRSPQRPLIMWATLAVIAALILLVGLFCRCEKEAASIRVARRDLNLTARGVFDLFFEKKAALPSFMMLVLGTGVCAVIVFIGLYGQVRNFGSAGSFFVVTAITMILTRLGSGLFMDKRQPIEILLPTLFMSVMAFVMLAYSSNRVIFILSGIPFGVGFGVATPLLASVAVKRSPQNRSGAANSMFYLCLNLGFGTGALLGGKVIDAYGFHNALLLGTLTALIPGALGLIFLTDGKLGTLKENASTTTRKDNKTGVAETNVEA